MSSRAGRWLTGCWAMIGLVAVGCKTDALHRVPPAPPGPTTSLSEPEGVKLPQIKLVDQEEVDLVENVLRYRALYARYLEALRDYYKQSDKVDKLAWAQHELDDLYHVKPYKYLLSAEVPTARLKPSKSIPEADALFAEARELMKQAGHGVPALYYERRMKEALAKFKALIERYPNSDKIGQAAYWCGYIHKEYFKGDELIAVRWFERAWQWDPQIQLPARFEAAVVLDFRLHDRDKALELYRAVLEHERFNKSNVRFAVNRIEQLTRQRQAPLPRRPPSAAASPAEPAGSKAPSAQQ